MKITTGARAFGIGLVTGMRSMTGLAATSWRDGDRLRYLYTALAAGELVVDKLPMTPARTAPPGLAARAVAGAYAGNVLARSFKGNRVGGALAGLTGAIAGAFLFAMVRERIGKSTGLPDPVVALAEDTLAIGGAIALTRS